ncbi:MAG: hypothetical protein WC381_10635 [Kiritimatiellia bacterium]|jgi:hypothetical protein
MKKTYYFASAMGTVPCVAPSGATIDVPVIPGLLKHPTPDALPMLLRNPDVARKYTMEALRKASWPILRRFPAEWLLECLDEAHLTLSRRRAIMFLLS